MNSEAYLSAYVYIFLCFHCMCAVTAVTKTGEYVLYQDKDIQLKHLFEIHSGSKFACGSLCSSRNNCDCEAYTFDPVTNTCKGFGRAIVNVMTYLTQATLFYRRKREEPQVLGWNCTSTSCYYVSDYQTVWEIASVDCSCKGAHLAILTSAEEEAKVSAIALENKMTGTGGFWLDGTDVRQEGTWIWSTTGENFTYINFLKKQPDNAYENEHCLELWYYDDILQWNDAPCTIRNRQFICETDL